MMAAEHTSSSRRAIWWALGGGALGGAIAVAVATAWRIASDDIQQTQRRRSMSTQTPRGKRGESSLKIECVGSGTAGTEALQQLKPLRVPYDRVVTRMDETATVRQTLAKLLENDSSCILTRLACRGGGEKIWGIVDLTDVVPFMLGHGGRSLDDAVGGAVQRVATISCGSTLMDALLHFSGGIRYVLVGSRPRQDTSDSDDTDDSTGSDTSWSIMHPTPSPEVLSQGSLLRFIHGHHLEYFNGTVEQLPKKRLIVAEPGVTASEAYSTMSAHSITSLPCVDAKGHPIAVLSLTDAKYLANLDETQTRAALALDASVFAAHSQGGRENPRARPVVTCQLSDSLEQVATQMVNEKVHHIYVVEQDQQDQGAVVVSVVSIVDLLRTLCLVT